MKNSISYLLALILAPGMAWASQQLNANLYAFFKWDGGPFVQNLDQRLSVVQKAKTTYWAMQWELDKASASGYLGLQTDGDRFDGSTGDTAIFSIWGSLGHKGRHCAQFPYESGGTGFSCRLPYPITPHHWYRLRVWKLSADARSVWWGAWVLDETSGVESYLGALQVAATQTALSGHSNFSEYYGDAVPSPEKVPRSIVYWTAPQADTLSPRKYRFNSVFLNGTKDKGTTGSVTNMPVNTPSDKVEVVRIIQGG